MKLNLFARRALPVVVALTVSAAVQAQNVVITTSTLSDTALGGGEYAYTLTVNNTGTEAVDALWVGWIPGHFYINSPTSTANLQGWNSTPELNSIQYGGDSGDAIQPGHSGTFTFDSTTTPAQMAAGDDISWAYGVNTPSFGSNLNADDQQFSPQAVPEPSTLGLIAIGSLGVPASLRRKTEVHCR